MEEINDPHALAALLRDTDTKLVTIDGFDGSGKSSLALHLYKELGGNIVEIDCYALKGGKYELGDLTVYRLKRRLFTFRRESDLTLVEGVLMGEVIEATELKPEKKIYVMPPPSADLPAPEDKTWGEKYKLMGFDSVAEALKSAEEDHESDLSKQVVEYTFDKKPQASCDYLFRWPPLPDD